MPLGAVSQEYVSKLCSMDWYNITETVGMRCIVVEEGYMSAVNNKVCVCCAGSQPHEMSSCLTALSVCRLRHVAVCVALVASQDEFLPHCAVRV
jgi:hypothetical protein